MNRAEITLRVNGRSLTRTVPTSRTLLGFLREDLGLTGTKEGCGEGECGACTVLLNGAPVCSCLLLAARCDGAEILTIEGLGAPDAPDPIQEAFLESGAVQCGFCTPGMVMAAKALLDKNPDPTDEEIRTAMSGNLCRCTGYVRILKAVRLAAKKRGEQRV